MINKTLKLKDIINNTRVLNNLQSPIEDYQNDGFPIGSGSSQGGGNSGGGMGGGTAGTTSSNLISGLTLSPNTNQSIVTGTTLCLNASGVLVFPQEGEQSALLTGGCSAMSVGSLGTWVKNCGTNGNYDGEAYDTNLIYKNRPFQFTGTNASFINNPGGQFNNVHLMIGVKTTGGYKFIWEVYRYCNANGSSNCGSRWISTCKLVYPNGAATTLNTGYVEFNQQFRLRSDGNTISWDYTTEGKWVYNRIYMTIPADSGDFQFIVNALWMGNVWTNLMTYKGSYQATPRPEDYIWTSDCTDNLVITGNKACYTPITPGYCKICVSTINLTPQCVSVVSSPLTLTPVGIDCENCGGNQAIQCENIPNPTLPIVTLSSSSSTSISINWASSISFTTGLFYEININGDIQTTLDNDVIINSLPPATYTISVRAIDSCGESTWSTPQNITLS